MINTQKVIKATEIPEVQRQMEPLRQASTEEQRFEPALKDE